MQTALELLGMFFFAVSGSLLAAHRGFDIVGSVLLGSLTALGGGVIRDLVLGESPAAFTQPTSLLVPVAAALVVFFFSAAVDRLPRVLLVFDAAGLGLFCTTGTAKALESGMNVVAAALLGVITGVGGGLLRDVVANRDPQLFDPGDIYAIPALGGAALVAGAWMIGVEGPFVQLAIGLLVFGFRLASLRWHWRAPRAVARPTTWT